jgi:hypothetical protein
MDSHLVEGIKFWFLKNGNLNIKLENHVNSCGFPLDWACDECCGFILFLTQKVICDGTWTWVQETMKQNWSFWTFFQSFTFLRKSNPFEELSYLKMKSKFVWTFKTLCKLHIAIFIENITMIYFHCSKWLPMFVLMLLGNW